MSVAQDMAKDIIVKIMSDSPGEAGMNAVGKFSEVYNISLSNS